MSRIVSVKNGDFGDLFDANGLAIQKCIEANLDSGICTCFDLDENGKFQTVHGPDGLEAKTVTKKHAAPLVFVTKGDP